MKRQARMVGFFLLCCGTVVLLSGCGSSSGAAKTHKVTGKVTSSDGAPVKGATIQFTGVGSKAFQTSGITGDDGSYKLSTFEEGDGAPEGEYAVGITDASGTMAILEGEAKVSVKAGGGNTFDYKVKKSDAPAAGETP